MYGYSALILSPVEVKYKKIKSFITNIKRMYFHSKSLLAKIGKKNPCTCL